MCDVLKEIYYEIYEEKFNYEDLKDRIKMQKSIYILENMGISVGDYSFSWNKYGPYSLQLDSDAKRCINEGEHNVVFSKEAKGVFSRIRGLISQSIEYSVENWLECITSLHFLRCILKYDEGCIIDELVKRKPHLNSAKANKKALEISCEIKVG